MLRILFNALITLSAMLATGAVSAQVGPLPPEPTINGWAYSTIESNIYVNGISQVHTSSSGSNGPTQEVQHVAYSHTQGLVRYATRSNANGGAWSSNWTVNPGALICRSPSLAVDEKAARPFINCIEGSTVKVGWLNDSGVFVQGFVDLAATDPTAGSIALRLNAIGQSLRAIHVIYIKGTVGNRVVAHRYCTTFPSCLQPSDWRGADGVFPQTNFNSSSRPALVATSSTSVQAAVVEINSFSPGGSPQPGGVAFVRWNETIGWNGAVVQRPVNPLPWGSSVLDLAFKRNVNGMIAAITATDRAYVIDWNETGPYRYHKISGEDYAIGVDVVRTSPTTVAAVYRTPFDELKLARRGSLDVWSRELILAQPEFGSLARVDRAIDGKLLVTFADSSAAKLRSIYR